MSLSLDLLPYSYESYSNS